MIRDYNSLAEAALRWAQRKDVDLDRVSEFVQMVEAHIYPTVRTMRMASRKVIRTVPGIRFYKLPEKSRGFRTIEIETTGKRYPLHYYTPAALDEHYGFVVQSGVPVAYTVQAGQIEIAPNPAAEYPLRITVYAPLPSLESGQDGNWMIEDYPNVYLYGVMHFLYLYVRDAEGAKEFGDKFVASINQVNNADIEDRWTGESPAMRAT